MMGFAMLSPSYEPYDLYCPVSHGGAKLPQNAEVGAEMHKALAAIICAFILSGCGTTIIPVAVIGQRGEILRGENKVSLSEGSFSVTDGKLTCVGSYNPLNQSRTITVTLVCSDGRRGIAIATRDSPVSGGGKVTLSDGEEGTFVFGDAATKI